MRNANTHPHKSKLNKDKNINNSDSEQSETEEESSKKIIIHKALLKEIDNTLTQIISEKKNSKKNQNDIFSHVRVPKIPLFDYLLRIQKYTRIDNSTIIMALIYIDRVCIRKGLTLTNYNIHRLLFTSILISIKFNEDIIYDNLLYSKIGGVPVAELNKLEHEFLKMIGFSLFVSEEVYKKYYTYLHINENSIKD